MTRRRRNARPCWRTRIKTLQQFADLRLGLHPRQQDNTRQPVQGPTPPPPNRQGLRVLRSRAPHRRRDRCRKGRRRSASPAEPLQRHRTEPSVERAEGDNSQSELGSADDRLPRMERALLAHHRGIGHWRGDRRRLARPSVRSAVHNHVRPPRPAWLRNGSRAHACEARRCRLRRKRQRR